MIWENTRTIYSRLVAENPLMARDYVNLIKAVHMDCKNATSSAFSALELDLKDIGRQDDPNE